MAEITPNTANPVREDAYVTELATKLGIDAKYIPKSPTWRNEEEIKVLADLFANMSAGGGSGLPDTPGTDGTYALQNTVSGGTGTLSWGSGGSSGGGALMVTVDANDYPENTYAEIAAAAAEGPVILKYPWDTGGMRYCYLFHAGYDDMEYQYVVKFRDPLDHEFEYGAETEDGAWTNKVIPS